MRRSKQHHYSITSSAREQLVWNMARLLFLVKIQLVCLPAAKPRVTFAQ
jgi:hypothetical protein